MRLDEAITEARRSGQESVSKVSGRLAHPVNDPLWRWHAEDILATDWEVVRRPLEVWLCNRTGNGSLKECVRPSEGSHNQRLFREVL